VHAHLAARDKKHKPCQARGRTDTRRRRSYDRNPKRDAIGFIGLGGLFTAHVTGNLVVLAAHIVAGKKASVATTMSVPVFILVLGLTRLLAGGLERVRVASLRPLAAGLWSLALPTGLALIALVMRPELDGARGRISAPSARSD
jgi:uncharacterized protein DUF1275